MRHILLVLLLSLSNVALAQTKELSWRDRAQALTQQVVSKVQDSWVQLKSWVAEKNASLSGAPAPNRGPKPASVDMPAQPADVSQQAVSQTPVSGAPTAPQAPVAQTPTVAPNAAVSSQAPQAITPQANSTPAPVNLAKVKEAAQKQKVFTVVEPGQKAGEGLKLDKAGVAHAEFMMAKGSKSAPMPKAIPRLNIGRESKLSAQDFALDKVQIETLAPKTVEKRPSVALISAQSTRQTIQKVLGPNGPSKVGAPKKITEAQSLQDRILSLAKVQSLKANIKPLKEFNEKPYVALSQNDLRTLAALVLVERGDQCHVAAGLLFELRNEKGFESEANHYLALCAQKMGLISQYVNSLLKVIASEDSQFLPKALEQMNVDLPYESEVKVGLALSGIHDKKLIPASAKAKVNYLAAKAHLKSQQFAQALSFAREVPDSFAKYPEAQYILATAQYATGQSKQALETQEKLLSYLEGKIKRSDFVALLELNLGRIAFQDKQFNKAKDFFFKIDKSHPLWIEALMEQGWAQLQSGDVGGAIGNMYSVHSPFFRDVFVPESYVIRTIGYLNLCQYGDAYKTLSMFEHNYRPWMDAMDKYASLKHPNSGTYETVRKYLKSPSTADIDGLPHQVIREMARQRDFLNHQQALNAAEDEIAQYKFIENMLIKDKTTVLQNLAQIRPRLADLQRHMAESKARREPDDVQERWHTLYKRAKDEEAFYHFRLDIHLDSRKLFATMTDVNLAKIAEAKAGLRASADKVLAHRLNTMRKDLAQMLENNELLRYEVFSGSGENLRFQAAGGNNKRVPASVKPVSKNLQWEFDGEYWADEIGNYRSTLANNCPEARGPQR